MSLTAAAAAHLAVGDRVQWGPTLAWGTVRSRVGDFVEVEWDMPGDPVTQHDVREPGFSDRRPVRP